MHFASLLFGDRRIPENSKEGKKEDSGREDGSCKSDAIRDGIKEKWRPIACAGFLFLAPCCGLAAFWFIYSAVNVKKMSFLNVVKVGIAFALIASAGIVVHVAFNLLYFGQAYRGPLL